MSEAEAEQESSSLRPLLAHGLRHWRRYLLGFVSLAAVDFINSNILTRLIGEPFKAIEAGEGRLMPWAVLALVYAGITVAQMGLRYLWRYFFMGAAERIALEIRRDF